MAVPVLLNEKWANLSFLRNDIFYSANAVLFYHRKFSNIAAEIGGIDVVNINAVRDIHAIF